MTETTTEERGRYSIVDGAHSFRTDDGSCVSIDLPLTGHQVEFLARNPAAVRACLVKGWFTLAWLEALMDQIGIVDAGHSSRRTWH